MDWIVFVVQWFHVLLGITWFGAAIYVAFILIPAITPMTLSRQREVGTAIGASAFVVLRPVSMAVIALGIVRGTLFGPIKSAEALTTAYGVTWLVALVVAIATYVWAERIIGPALNRMNAIPEADAMTPDGTPTPAFDAAIADVKRKSVMELGFFLVIFTCMILMRFGL